MKKILFFALTLLLCFTLVGCGKNSDKTTDLVKDKDWMTPGEMVNDYLSLRLFLQSSLIFYVILMRVSV